MAKSSPMMTEISVRFRLPPKKAMIAKAEEARPRNIISETPKIKLLARVRVFLVTCFPRLE